MPIITLKQAQELPNGQLKEWAYNTLDTTGTREIADILLPRMDNATRRTYSFERALQTPAVSMGVKGVRVDVSLRNDMVKELKREIIKDERAIAKMVEPIWDGSELETGWCPANLGKRHKWPRGVDDNDPAKVCACCGTSRKKRRPFNPGSPHQLKHLFYVILQVDQHTGKTGEVTIDDEALAKIGQKYEEHYALTEAIRNYRDKDKQLGTLSARLTNDGRYPSNFNVGAAWTGRFSSSKNPFGEGGNLQNIASRHRATFIADPGFDLAYIDLKQAESNVVAHLSGDERYIEAHKSGDVHTYVARLVWPELPWTGDLKKDKVIAKGLPKWDEVEGHDFRFQAKRIQHGSNFGLTPFGIAIIAHIPVKDAKYAQRNYFTEFDRIPAWQSAVRAEVAEHRPLVNLLDRTISLFGRPWDGHTQKQGLAFKPQSTVADILDLAMLRIWDKYDPRELQLLAQVHDALLIQFPRGKLDIIRGAVELMKIPVPVNGRIMVIEPELAVGRNWGKKTATNPYGMEEIE